MLGDQDVLVTAASSDGEAPNVICIYIGYRFGPNVHFVRSDRGEGIKIRLESLCSFVGRLGLGFGGSDALPGLGKMNLYGFFEGRDFLVALV